MNQKTDTGTTKGTTEVEIIVREIITETEKIGIIGKIHDLTEISIGITGTVMINITDTIDVTIRMEVKMISLTEISRKEGNKITAIAGIVSFGSNVMMTEKKETIG